jgi:hypothetical protein
MRKATQRRRARGLALRSFVIALGAVVALAATSCMNVRKVPLSYELSRAVERDGVLPEGAVCRESGSTSYVCIFGVADPAVQDLVVEGVRESLRRLGRTGYGVTVQFWSGDPPPRGVDITVKEIAKPTTGETPLPSETAAERNARYGISLVRAVRIESPASQTAPR